MFQQARQDAMRANVDGLLRRRGDRLGVLLDRHEVSDAGRRGVWRGGPHSA